MAPAEYALAMSRISWLAVGVCAACSDPDPAAESREAYAAMLQPVAFENALVLEQVLAHAAGVYNKTLSSDEAVQRWTYTISPLAEHVADQTALIEPPAEWVGTHEELIAIWADRAAAYRELSDAIYTAEPERWKAARSLAENIKIREEAWFVNFNRTAERGGIRLDPYP